MKSLFASIVGIFGFSFLLLFLTSSVSAAFADIPDSYIFSDAVKYSEENKIVGGYSDGTFRPYDPISRSQLIKIIVNYKYSQEEIDKCSFIEFPDVATSNVFKKHICIAKLKQLVKGYSDGKFYPDRFVTTGEASKIIANSLGLTTGEDPDPANMFKFYIDALAARNALPLTLTQKDKYITRGELVEILYRLANNITVKESETYDTLQQQIVPDTVVVGTVCPSEIEVETISTPRGFKVVEDTTASGGKILQASGKKSTDTPNTAELTEICLYSPGVSKIQVLAKAASGSDDSMWVTKDTTIAKLEIDEKKGFVWHTVTSITLQPGNNIIKIGTRELGLKIDKIRIFGSIAVPTVTPMPTITTTPTVTITPVVTPTKTPTPTSTPTKTPTPVPTVKPTSTPVPTTTPNPSAGAPSDLLRNYKQWKITLPTGSEVKNLLNVKNEYFYVNNDKSGIVFKTPIRSGNGTTSNSDYIRSELRERTIDGSADIYWTTAGKHVMYVKQSINHLPIVKNELVASQIHGNKAAGIDDAMVLRLEGSDLFLSFNGGKLRSDVPVKTDAGANGKYTLGKMHEFILEVVDGKHMAYYSEDGGLYNAYFNGTADKYAVKENGNKVLMTKTYGEAYFKAGNYTQSNMTKEGAQGGKPENYGEVVLYDVWVKHE